MYPHILCPPLRGTPYPMVAAKDGHNGMDGYLHGCVSRVWHADAYRDAYHVICSNGIRDMHYAYAIIPYAVRAMGVYGYTHSTPYGIWYNTIHTISWYPIRWDALCHPLRNALAWMPALTTTPSAACVLGICHYAYAHNTICCICHGGIWRIP